MNPSTLLAALVDLALVVAIVEWLALWLLHRHWQAGPAPADIAANLAAGLALMLTARLVIAQAPVGVIALCLAGAGIAHVTDLHRRWPRRSAPADTTRLP
jgi:hypothetical protein